MARKRIRRRYAISRTPKGRQNGAGIDFARSPVRYCLRDELQQPPSLYAVRFPTGVGLTLRVGRGLSRHGQKEARGPGSMDRAEFAAADKSLCRYGTATRTGLCEVCGRGLVRKEYLHHQSKNRILALSWLYSHRS